MQPKRSQRFNRYDEETKREAVIYEWKSNEDKSDAQM